MGDIIRMSDLYLRTRIGISDFERHDRQDLLLTLEVATDTRAAGRSDLLDETLNYRTLAKRIIAHVEGHDFFLVEKVAEDVAEIALTDPRAERVRVTVEKP